MRQYRAVAALLALVFHPACAQEANGEEPVDSSASALLAADETLWPLDAKGHATVRVCWLPPDLGGVVFPADVTQAALDEVLAERQTWTREAVEREWNGRTPLRFVGWKDCDGSEVDFQMQAMSSGAMGVCRLQRGRSCVDHLGRNGKKLSLNLLWDFEVRTAVQMMIDDPDHATELRKAWGATFVPALCAKDVGAAFRDPTAAHLAAFESVAEQCSQFAAVHEFGHIAGFAHEQNRQDDPKQAKACADRIGMDGSHVATAETAGADAGDHPLGEFDPESIMSYCRTDPSATLSAGDVEAANAVYGAAGASTKKTKSADLGDGDEPVEPWSKEHGGCNG